jgi:hypothetical protein
MPSRAASVQIKMRSGSVAASALKRRLSSSRRSVDVARLVPLFCVSTAT